jgi:hypothetical protein
MRDEPLSIEDLGVQNQKHVLKLTGPLTLSTLFEFQNLTSIRRAWARWSEPMFAIRRKAIP